MRRGAIERTSEIARRACPNSIRLAGRAVNHAMSDSPRLPALAAGVATALRSQVGGPDVTRSGDGISHVIFCLHPDSIAGAARTFGGLLQIAFEGPIELSDQGLVIYRNWVAGIELMAPVDPELAIDQARFLQARGEGLYRLVYQVGDRDAALASASALGCTVITRYDLLDLFPKLRDQFSAALESHVEPICGVSLNFAQYVRRVDRTSTHSTLSR